MKPVLSDREKVNPDGGPVDAGYTEWKRAKIETGLAQIGDRAAMIPIDQVWRDLKLER